jgi:hypothetical protein
MSLNHLFIRGTFSDYKRDCKHRMTINFGGRLQTPHVFVILRPPKDLAVLPLNDDFAKIRMTFYNKPRNTGIPGLCTFKFSSTVSASPHDTEY